MRDAPLYRVIYLSRIRILPEQQHTELARILADARARNAASAVTGALLFNGTGFAQALEGALPEVAAIFERIQRDPRHGDVVVLESAAVPERAFPDWAMAYAGEVEDADLDPATTEAGRVLALLHALVGTTVDLPP